MRWLHITDVHVGRPDEAQKSAMRSLVDAIRTHSGSKPYDVVLLSGDLAYSGQKTEYERFDELLVAALRKEAVCRAASFIAVPGNHDLDCDLALPCRWTELDLKRQTKWFGNDVDGKRVRAPRAHAFTAYSEYVRRAGIDSFDPLERCSKSSLVTSAGRKFAFIGLNTALLSDASRSDERETPAPVLALRGELQSLDGATPIVVGHHPIAWFTHITQEPFRTALLEANAIYVHGHLHQVRVMHSHKGLETLGFGAAYPNPLDGKADAYYENAFAICEIDDALHVKVCAWDAVHGQWRISNRLPADFQVSSGVLEDGFRFPIPSHTGKSTRTRPLSVNDACHRAARPSSILGLEILAPEAWWRVLRLIGEVDAADAPPPRIETAGEVEFRVEGSHGVRIVRCISGQGRILSARELEAENTRLDTEEHDAVTIVSLGQAEDAARQLAVRLSRKKSFKLMCNEDVATAISLKLTGAVQHHLDGLDMPDSSLAYIIDEGGVGVVVHDGTRGDWFYVVKDDGSYSSESSRLVQRIRETKSLLSRAAYQPPGAGTVSPPPSGLPPAFERDEFLSLCRAEFDELKYAPLAALGFKFPKAKLLDIYVPATAELGEESAATQQLRQALDDFIDSMDLDEAARAQIRAQVAEKYFKGGRNGGSARAFYHQHRNVLVLGDPGSGKTCFVKNEVLSYCQPPTDGADWYKLHTPLLVPLVEAAPLLRDEGQLLKVCATIAARRGLPITPVQLESLVANGHVAFFFDGLDEVPSMEQRARLMRAVGSAVEAFAPLGNRIVLTSRPAALEALDVPKDLVRLHLRHLSAEEIRVLAHKILAMQLTEEGQRVGFGTSDAHETSIVDRLLADCDAKPGIGRLARNPLLLSLLVMIYANSGAPTAKKHRIYAQAVQTLVSVRNRAAGTTVLSESDLRRRLGALALAIYEERIPELPTRDVVVRVVGETLTEEKVDGNVRDAAEAFVQRVAEGTGLLTVHPIATSTSDATITFMHHSFLEYYAAVGLVGGRSIDSLPALAEARRWREVVSLAAGLIGDQADVAPLIEQLLLPRQPGDDVAQGHLLFGFDCALECDVPPEKAQVALSSAVAATMSRGAGRVDGSFRRDLAERLARLWEATGSVAISRCLQDGLRSEDARVTAAYADVVGLMGMHTPLPAEVLGAFDALAPRREGVLRIAVFGAAARCSELRSDGIVEALRHGFEESFPVKYAAARALEDAPSLAKRLLQTLKGALDDTQLPVAAAASRAVLESGVEVASKDTHNRLLVEKCLRRWEQVAEPRSASKLNIRARREDIDQMLSSPSEEERVLAIRLLPWLERQETYVHERLFEVLVVNRGSAEVIAALASLRLSAGAVALCTSRDIDRLINLAKDAARSRDVRIAAVRALSVVSPEDRVVSALLERCRNTEHGEYRECMRSLATCAPSSPIVREFVQESLREGLAGPIRGEFGKPARQYDLKRLMRIAGELGVDVGDSVAGALVTLAESFKAPEELRTQAIRTYARVAPSTARTVEQVIVWLQRRAHPFEAVVPGVVPDVLMRARQRVDSVRAIYPALSGLQEVLIDEWQRVRPERARFIDDHAFRGLRSALRELRDIRAAFSEFGAKEGPPSVLALN